MNISVACDLAIIAGFTCYIFFPFCGKRLRATWATRVFVLSGLIGVAKGIARLMLDEHWFQVSNDMRPQLYLWLRLVDGILLGFIFSLILSGQLLGTKRAMQDGKHETAG
jgi:hypothetical protein